MCPDIIILLWFVACSKKKPYITRFRVIQGILLSQCCRPRMTVSRGFLKSNCSHTTNSLTYCRRTYLLDITCFECAPNCALSMSRAIVLCYFYKASAGLCRTHVRKSLLGFLNHTLLKIYICSIQRICITSTSILFRHFNRLFVFITCIFNKVSPSNVIHL